MIVNGVLTRAQLEKITNDPAGERIVGLVWLDETSLEIKFDNGSVQKVVVTEDSDQTLTNKTLTEPTVNRGEFDYPAITNALVKTATPAVPSVSGEVTLQSKDEKLNIHTSSNETFEVATTAQSQELSNKVLNAVDIKGLDISPDPPTGSNGRLYTQNGRLFMVLSSGDVKEIGASEEESAVAFGVVTGPRRKGAYSFLEAETSATPVIHTSSGHNIRPMRVKQGLQVLVNGDLREFTSDVPINTEDIPLEGTQNAGRSLHSVNTDSDIYGEDDETVALGNASDLEGEVALVSAASVLSPSSILIGDVFDSTLTHCYHRAWEFVGSSTDDFVPQNTFTKGSNHTFKRANLIRFFTDGILTNAPKALADIKTYPTMEDLPTASSSNDEEVAFIATTNSYVVVEHDTVNDTYSWVAFRYTEFARAIFNLVGVDTGVGNFADGYTVNDLSEEWTTYGTNSQGSALATEGVNKLFYDALGGGTDLTITSFTGDATLKATNSGADFQAVILYDSALATLLVITPQNVLGNMTLDIDGTAETANYTSHGLLINWEINDQDCYVWQWESLTSTITDGSVITITSDQSNISLSVGESIPTWEPIAFYSVPPTPEFHSNVNNLHLLKDGSDIVSKYRDFSTFIWDKEVNIRNYKSILTPVPSYEEIGNFTDGFIIPGAMDTGNIQSTWGEPTFETWTGGTSVRSVYHDSTQTTTTQDASLHVVKDGVEVPAILVYKSSARVVYLFTQADLGTLNVNWGGTPLSATERPSTDAFTSAIFFGTTDNTNPATFGYEFTIGTSGALSDGLLKITSDNPTVRLSIVKYNTGVQIASPMLRDEVYEFNGGIDDDDIFHIYLNRAGELKLSPDKYLIHRDLLQRLHPHYPDDYRWVGALTFSEISSGKLVTDTFYTEFGDNSFSAAKTAYNANITPQTNTSQPAVNSTLTVRTTVKFLSFGSIFNFIRATTSSISDGGVTFGFNGGSVHAIVRIYMIVDDEVVNQWGSRKIYSVDRFEGEFPTRDTFGISVGYGKHTFHIGATQSGLNNNLNFDEFYCDVVEAKSFLAQRGVK